MKKKSMHTEFVFALENTLGQMGLSLTPEQQEKINTVQPEQPIGPEKLLREAWLSARLPGQPVRIEEPQVADLPLLACDDEIGWFMVEAPASNGWRIKSKKNEFQTIPGLSKATCFRLPETSLINPPLKSSALNLVWSAIVARRSVFIEATLATALVNLLALASSLYSMQVYDRVIPNQGIQTLWVLTVGVFFAAVLELLLKLARARSVDRTNLAIDHELSRVFFQHLVRMRMDQRPSSIGTLASQVKSLELIRSVLGSTSLFVLADIPFAIFFVVVIGLIGGWIVLIPVFAIPLALITGLMFQKKIRRLSAQDLAGSNLKTGLLVESIDGAESLKAAGGEWKMQSRWERLSKEVAATELAIKDCSALSQNFTVTFQQIGYVAIIACGAWLAADNRLTMGALLACSIISNRAMTPIIQLPGILVQWAHARAAIDGLNILLQLPADLDDDPKALKPKVLQAEYRLEQARFIYPGKDNAALHIEKLIIRSGERVGILGAVGSGKSSLLKLVSGLYRPSSGKVFLGGIDSIQLSPLVRRDVAAYLPQDFRLFSGTLRDNLILGLPDPGDDAILAAAKQTGLTDLISQNSSGLALPITEGGHGVSGGQRQLIALTRLLLRPPPIWLLDEPTGAMDAATESRILKLLQDLASRGATMLVATHKSALLPLFDRIIVLHGGRIAIDGPRDAVISRLSGGPAEAGVTQQAVTA